VQPRSQSPPRVLPMVNAQLVLPVWLRYLAVQRLDSQAGTGKVLTGTRRRWCHEVLNLGGAVERAPAS